MVKHVTEDKLSGERSDLKYKGVRKRKWGKWVSEIRLPNSRERIWLGSYDSAEKAARAFDAALFCLRGRAAKFNFPDNPPNIAGGRSLSPPEIQAAAARFANLEPKPVPEPPKSQLDNQCSMDQSASELQAESPSPSVVSDATVQLYDSDSVVDGSFLDMLMSTGPGNYATDYGIFPGFDDLHNDFFPPPPTIPDGMIDYGDENFDGLLAQDSFLWSF